MAAAIAHELSKPSIKDWIGPSTQVSVRKPNATRDWRNHLPSLGVKLEGGLLKDEDGNHLFLAMRRRGDIWVLYITFKNAFNGITIEIPSKFSSEENKTVEPQNNMYIYIYIILHRKLHWFDSKVSVFVI